MGWYNGHPAFSHLTSYVAETLAAAGNVAIVGQGNVALDVARILLKPISELEKTDMPDSVLDVLARSKVRRVSVVGRRGPAQVAFTTKEFREMLRLPGVSYAGLGVDDVSLNEARRSVEGDRPRKRLLGLMEGGNGVQGDKEFKLEFLKSPKEFLPADEDADAGSGRVRAVEWTENELLAPPPAPPTPPASQVQAVPQSQSSSVIARPTGRTSTTKAGMVVESVGYRSEPLDAEEGGVMLPFDVAKGRIRNIDGRLVDEQGIVVSSFLCPVRYIIALLYHLGIGRKD